jgi:hypothetical protein
MRIPLHMSNPTTPLAEASAIHLGPASEPASAPSSEPPSAPTLEPSSASASEPSSASASEPAPATASAPATAPKTAPASASALSYADAVALCPTSPRQNHRRLHRLCLNISQKNGEKFYVLNCGRNPMVFSTTIVRLVIANYGAFSEINCLLFSIATLSPAFCILF